MRHTDISLSLAQADEAAASEPQARELQQARISAVIPAFSEAQNVAASVAALAHVLDSSHGARTRRGIGCVTP